MVADRKIDMIIIHCADTNEDLSPTVRNEEMDVGVNEIEAWHRERSKTEPWSSYIDENNTARYIGYHYVIRRSGRIEPARPVREIGCHCKGANKSSIAVCWIGRHHMPEVQKQGLIRCVAELCVLHGLIPLDVHGHNHFSSVKTCPNFDSKMTFESIDTFRKAVEMAIADIK